MAITYDVPAGSIATIVGPAELRVKASSPESRYQMYDTGAPPALAPVIDAVTPASGILPDPVAIDVSGSNFTSTAVVVFDGVETPTAFVSATLLTATVSAAAAGGFDVLVRDGANESSAVIFTFTDPVARRK